MNTASEWLNCYEHAQNLDVCRRPRQGAGDHLRRIPTTATTAEDVYWPHTPGDTIATANYAGSQDAHSRACVPLSATDAGRPCQHLPSRSSVNVPLLPLQSQGFQRLR